MLIVAQGDVEQSLTAHVRRGVQEAKEIEAESIILMLNTFGGLVNEALSITTILGGVADIRTVAYIPVAEGVSGVSWSAGALIAFSCDEIYMEPGTSIGSATPVLASSEGMEAADEKVVSAIRAQIRALAEKNSYNTDIAVAMVDRDIELYELEQDGVYTLVQENAVPEGVKAKQFLTKEKLLALTAGEMEQYGQAKIVQNKDELYEILNLDAENDIVVVEQNALDNILAVLSSGVVRAVLTLIGMISIYFVISQGNFGITGVAGLLAFATLFLTSTLLGTLGSAEILLILIGVVLIVLEIFVIPGFGVAGISGALVLFLAFVLMQQDFVWPSFSWQWGIFWGNVMNVLLSLIISIILLVVGMMFWPDIMLRKNDEQEEDAHSKEMLQSLKDRNSIATLQVGDLGAAITALRPSGKAVFNDVQHQVRADGDYIEAKKAIVIVGKDSFDIIVKER